MFATCFGLKHHIITISVKPPLVSGEYRRKCWLLVSTCTNAAVISALTLSILLITFANSLDPDQAQHDVGSDDSDLDPSCLIL